MDRRHLEYFVAVAELGSFTRAAQALSLSQPSLSTAIGWLERDLGAPLFERHGRGVQLTPAGEALLEPARRSLRSIELARDAVLAVRQADAGRISIITHTLWAVDPLAEVIGGFRRLHPGIQITLTDPAYHGDVLDTVRLGGAELGVIEGTPPRGLMASRRIADQEMVAVLPPGYDASSHSRLSPEGGVTIDVLAEAGIVCTPTGTALRTTVDGLLEAVGLPTEVAVETAHLASVVPLVLAGAGAALLPRGVAEDARAKGAELLLLDPPVRRDVHVIWRKGRTSSLALAFVDFCVRNCRDAEEPT